MTTSIFLHIPKTAGTSLLVALRRAMRKGALVEYYENQPGKTFADVLPQAAGARVVFGHASFGIHEQLGIAPRYGTVLRRPVDRIVSLYHFFARSATSPFRERIAAELSLADFVASGMTEQADNHMTRILANRKGAALLPGDLDGAKENLARCDYVGTIEDLDQDGLEAFFQVGAIRLDRANAGQYRRDAISRADIEIIERHNVYDLELYEAAVALQRDRRAAARDRRLGETAALRSREATHLGRIAQFETDAATLRHREAEQRDAIARRDGEMSALRREAADLRRQDAAHRDAIARLESRWAAAQREMLEGAGRIRRQAGEIAWLRDEAAERLKAATAAATAASQRDVEIALQRAAAQQQERLSIALHALLRGRPAEGLKAQAEIARLEGALAEKDAAIAALMASTSWRVTAPLRRAKRALAGAGDGSRPAVATDAALAPAAAGVGSPAPDHALIEASLLFDTGFYLERNPEVALLGIDPIGHFVASGADNGCDPQPLFDVAYYRSQAPALAPGVNPLAHYLTAGVAARRDPSPFFSTGFYLDANPDVRRSGMNPLMHFCHHGLLERRWPTPQIDPGRFAGLMTAQPSPWPAVRLFAALAGDRNGAAAVLQSFKDLWRREADGRLQAFLRGGARLALAQAERPRVSVILVLYNQAAFTLDCLQSLAADAGDEIETIVVDNASSDATAALLERVDGLRLIRNADNRGFGAAVNQAAREARGEHLLLLNNDAILLPGAIRAALATMAAAEDIGAVGGRVILADGTLQEAGSIIWRDGSCHGYGRGGDPEAGEFRFRRDVDFCSGVFLLLRRAAFAAVGGFDEAFHPAYAEDADLCIRLRQRGYRTLYEPEAAVRHWEFASSGDQARAAALQQTMRPQFVAKHAAWLAAQPDPSPANRLAARAADRGRGRVLLVDDRVPHGWLGSGLPRAAALARAVVANGRSLTLFATASRDRGWREIRAALPAEVEVIAADRMRLAGFLAARRGHYDIIIVSRPHNMGSFNDFAAGAPEALRGVRVVYDAEALFALRTIGQASLLGRPLTADQATRLVDEEVALAARADEVLVVSAGEASEFRRRLGAKVTVLGEAVAPCPGPRDYSDRQGLLFVGPLREDGTPNVDAVTWFVEAVLPMIRRRDERIELRLAGLNDCPRIRALAGPGVRLLGVVPDLTGLYDESRLFVAPTRFAAGIPHKVVEAAAHGLPVVATGLLAGQLGWQPGRELLVGDGAGDFAAACLQAYDDADLWRRLRAAALERVAADHDPGRFADLVRAALAPAGADIGSAAAPDGSVTR